MSDPGPLRNSLGAPVATLIGPDGGARAAAPNGRLVVAAGQTIASAWGNTAYDQTMQTFASASDRSNQWPVPSEGALSYLVDTATPWIFRQGAWRGLPLGWLASSTGPTSQTDVPGTGANVVLAAATAQVGAGRRYRITGTIYASAVTAAIASGWAQVIDDQGSDPVFLFMATNTPVGAALAGGSVLFMQATTTRTATFQLRAASVGGAIRVNGQAAVLTVEEIGA